MLQLLISSTWNKWSVIFFSYGILQHRLQSIQRVVFTNTNVFTRMMLFLSDDKNVTGFSNFTTKDFNA